MGTERTVTSDERCAICTKTRDEHVSITTHKFKDDPRPSKERNILDLAKNLQDDLHVYCKGAAGSGDNFYARTFANLADRADELVKLLESAPETYERRLAEACERMRRAAALVAMAGDQSMALAIYDHSRRLLGDVPPWWDSENTPKASEPRPCPIPEADGFDIQGKEIGPGIWGVGKANWHPESGDWRGLADINGSLCVVTLKVTPSSEGECHIRPHDFCSAGTCKVCVDAARYRWLQDNGVLVLDETLTGDALDIAVDAERRHALQIANSVDCTQCPHPDACEASGGCPKIEGGDGG